MGLFDMLGGFASAGASVYEAGKNYDAQVLTNQANLDMNSANNAQNLSLTQQQWARDDNSIQRRTADMRAAGLNPVLAAGQGAQSSAPISMQAGKVIAPQVHGLSGVLGTGVSAYSDLVRAKEIKEQTKLATESARANSILARLSVEGARTSNQKLEESRSLQSLETHLKAAELRRQTHDNNYYAKTGLPSNAGASETNKILQARAAVQAWAKQHNGTLPSAVLDFLGGAE